MTQKTRTIVSWLMTAAVATSAFSAILGTSPSSGHRAWLAVCMGFMVLYNEYVWSTNHCGSFENVDKESNTLKSQAINLSRR